MWQPIKTYDALPLKKRPRFAVFYFPEEQDGRMNLRAMVQPERSYGARVCTLWMLIPDPDSTK